MSPQDWPPSASLVGTVGEHLNSPQVNPEEPTSYGASNDGHSLLPLERSLPGDLGSKQRKLLCHCPL